MQHFLLCWSLPQNVQSEFFVNSITRNNYLLQKQLLLGKNRLFNDWIMQEMAPHSLGTTTLLHKFVQPIAIIFYD